VLSWSEYRAKAVGKKTGRLSGRPTVRPTGPPGRSTDRPAGRSADPPSVPMCSGPTKRLQDRPRGCFFWILLINQQHTTTETTMKNVYDERDRYGVTAFPRYRHLLGPFSRLLGPFPVSSQRLTSLRGVTAPSLITSLGNVTRPSFGNVTRPSLAAVTVVS